MIYKVSFVSNREKFSFLINARNVAQAIQIANAVVGATVPKVFIQVGGK